LYRGFTSEIIKSTTQNGIYFFCYTSLKDLAKEHLETKPRAELSIPANLAVGMAAGVVTQCFVNPIGVVQTRLMTTSRNELGVSHSFLGVLLRIIREDGLAQLWSGLMPAMVLCLNPAIQFLVFDRLKAWWVARLQARESPRKPSAVELFIIGAIAKLVATIVTYPYIMAKMRLQWKPRPGDTAVARIQYKGAIDVIAKTLHHEGISGLFTGLQAQALKSMLGAALMFMCKEKAAEYSNVFADLVQRLSCGRKLL